MTDKLVPGGHGGNIMNQDWDKIEGHRTKKNHYPSIRVDVGNSSRRVIKKTKKTVIIDSIPNDEV